MKNLQKHLTRITSSNKNRPILNGAYFNTATGSIVATDGHRILSYKQDNLVIDNKVINLDTMEELEGKFPNVERLFPTNTELADLAASNNLSELLKTLTPYRKEVIEMTFNLDCIDLTIINNWKDIESVERIELPSIELGATSINEGSIINLNVGYLIDSLKFLIDFKKYQDKEAHFTLCYSGANKPIMIVDNSGKFKYVIAHIRLGGK